MLTTMIEDGQSVMCDNQKLYEETMSQYVKYRSSKYDQDNAPLLISIFPFWHIGWSALPSIT